MPEVLPRPATKPFLKRKIGERFSCAGRVWKKTAANRAVPVSGEPNSLSDCGPEGQSFADAVRTEDVPDERLAAPPKGDGKAKPKEPADK